MAEATGVPISELTLGEAESFLNSLMCLPLPEKPNIEGKLSNCLKQLLNDYYTGLNLCHVGHSQLWGNLISWKKSEKFNLAFLQRWQTVHTWKFSTAVLVISIVKILVVAFTVLITAHAQFLADRHLTAMQWCVQAVLWCTHCTAVDNAAIYTKTTDFQLSLRFHKCAITVMFQ